MNLSVDGRRINRKHTELPERIQMKDAKGNETTYVKLEETIRVNIPELIETATYVPEGRVTEYIVICEPVKTIMDKCNECEAKRPYSAGFQKQDRFIADLPIGTTPVHLQLSVPRYRCQECGHRMNHSYEFVEDGKKVTKRLVEEIKRRTLSETYLNIARDTGVSVTLVRSLAIEYGRELDEARGKAEAPRILGIDEKHINHLDDGVALEKHKLCLILTDIEKGEIIEIYPTNIKSQVKTAITRLKNLENIEYVCTDLASGYRAVVMDLVKKGILNEGVVVIPDRFHVIRTLQTRVQECKKLIIAHLETWIESDEVTEEQRKHYRTVLKEVKSNAYLFKHSPKNIATTQARANRMTRATATFPEFETLRIMKDMIYTMYDVEAGDVESAKEILDEWEKYVKKYSKNPLFEPMQTMRRTMHKWRNEILTYFSLPVKYSNAATEGLNSVIGAIQSQGRGYAYEQIRTKAVHGISASKKTKARTTNLSLKNRH